MRGRERMTMSKKTRIREEKRGKIEPSRGIGQSTIAGTIILEIFSQTGGNVCSQVLREYSRQCVQYNHYVDN
jgi:hypothetical protein